MADPHFSWDQGTADATVVFRVWIDREGIHVDRVYELYRDRYMLIGGEQMDIMRRIAIPDPVQHEVRESRDPRRWFDVFRTFSQAFWSVCDLVQVSKFRRPQARCDHAQRIKHKRKRFLEALRA